MQTKNQCNKLTTLKYFEIKSASPAVKKGKTKVYNQFALLKLYKTQRKQHTYAKRKKGNKNHSPASPLMCKHNDRS